MKKFWVWFVIIVVLGGVIFLATDSGGFVLANLQPTSVVPTTQNVVFDAPVRASNEVHAEGRLVPIQYVSLGFNTNGMVQEVFAVEGQAVTAGTVLARLHNQEKIQVDIATAKLEVANAVKTLNDLNNNAALTAAQVEYDLVQAKKELREAQSKRFSLDVPRASENSLMLAQVKYDDAQKELDRIQKEYDNLDYNGRKLLIEALEAAKKDRNTALANLNYKLGKPSGTDFDEANAHLWYVEQQVADLERRLAIYKNGPDPDELNIAQASLENANAQLTAAQAALDSLEIRAPFDGTIVNLDLKVGQYVAPGQTILTLADFSKWTINTTDLTELNVLNIQAGNPVAVSFDALPGEAFNGVVTYVKPMGENQQGDITYTVIIAVDNTDPRLRWNMTAPVVIQTQ